MHVERTPDGLTIDVASEDETTRVGQSLAELVGPGVVIALIGPLGAGKTRLSRAICEALGVDGTAISSPTFVLIHEYEGRLPVFHFDAYRLSGVEEFEALGVSDYWSAGGVFLVEWADRVSASLPDDAWTIRLEPTGPNSRRLQVHLPTASTVAVALAERLGRD